METVPVTASVPMSMTDTPEAVATWMRPPSGVTVISPGDWQARESVTRWVCVSTTSTLPPWGLET
ncbi:hypothetical protein ACIP17_10590 [Streptomyces iakyrus]|uniref:hypothetical protein n=1 Tax=Streptomyces iakyrus TaxID=68219 RepID=UPI0037FBC238